MAPAANTNDLTYNAQVALQKDKMSIARALMEPQHQQSDTEEKIAAIMAARQVEARKEQELELARAIRRRHKDEQIQRSALLNQPTKSDQCVRTQSHHNRMTSNVPSLPQ